MSDSVQEYMEGIRVWLADYDQFVRAGGTNTDWRWLAGSARVHMKIALDRLENPGTADKSPYHKVQSRPKLTDLPPEKIGIVPMPFGKYRDQPLGDVVEYDPDYCRWFVENIHDKPDLTAALRRLLDAKGR